MLSGLAASDDDDPFRGIGYDADDLDAMLKELMPPIGDAPEPQIDRAEELREQWQTETGQIWQCGRHRVMCGDSTKAEDVERLLASAKINLLCTDPPYGMGKESEGVANDNLYRTKLDAFLMEFWKACRPSLYNNASAYIFGNAEDLWRLWYVGGLRDSERLTFRNEIVWYKGNGGRAVGTEKGRSYQSSERCFFFMLGEQGFNENADNYWEGWEPVRLYLEGERKKMGWDIPTMKSIVGHSDLSRDHWTSKSQWLFPTREVYEKLRQAAKTDAFKREYDELKREYDELKREYDELKREFYETRAYFDNTHDNMTDVWDFPRVIGEERQGHPTPKPIEMLHRIIKSSSRNGDAIFDPFLGSGTTMVAAQSLDRICYGLEIDPSYVAVILERMNSFGLVPILIKNPS